MVLLSLDHNNRSPTLLADEEKVLMEITEDPRSNFQRDIRPIKTLFVFGPAYGKPTRIYGTYYSVLAKFSVVDELLKEASLIYCDLTRPLRVSVTKVSCTALPKLLNFVHHGEVAQTTESLYHRQAWRKEAKSCC